MSAFRGFVRKEVFHLIRDRQTLSILIFMPLIQVILYGFAIRTEVDNIKVAFVEPAPDHITAAIRARFGSSHLFRPVGVVRSTAPLNDVFQRREARQAIVFDTRFAEKLARGEPADVLIVTDATDPNSGSIMQAYALSVLQDYEDDLRAASPGGVVRIVPRTRMRFNPSLESVNLFVPGLVAYILTLVSALMTAISISREKEMGTMEVLLVSPLRPIEIVVGKVVPYIGLGFANVLMLLAASRLIFGVPVRGSVVLLLAEALLYTVTALSLGVLISTRATSQRTAMMAALGGLMLPTLLLSGFIFPIESMPAPLRAVSNIIPARWFVLIVRGILVKGAGIAQLWQETLILAAMTAFLITVSAKRLAVRLE